MTLGTEFRFNNNDYGGSVVASAEGFHFVIDPNRSRMQGGGLIGAALSVVAQHYASQSATASCYAGQLSELPPEIVHDSDWPVRQQTGHVLVVPREAVERVRIPWFWLDNRIYITTADSKFSTVYNWFRLKKIRNFLTDLGWEIDE